MAKIGKDYYFELAVFLMDYHSGQWSRGYRLLCRLQANSSSTYASEICQSEAYHYLVTRYADTV